VSIPEAREFFLGPAPRHPAQAAFDPQCHHYNKFTLETNIWYGVRENTLTTFVPPQHRISLQVTQEIAIL
jgi:hypothetical protein